MQDSVLCMYPWTHVSVQPDGSVYSCCWAVAHPELGSLRRDRLDEIWNGKAMREIRRQMVAGEPVKQCSRCYENERAGGGSHRLWANRFLRSSTEHLHRTLPDGTLPGPPPLAYLELRFSNLCNFRCRTCSPEYSTAWNREAAILGVAKERLGLRTPMGDPDALFEWIAPLIPGLKEIYFAGGEPLITKEHYRFLNLLKAQARPDILLVYDTNFSRLGIPGHDVLEEWRYFKRVSISASLDGCQSQGEYIRKGMSWRTIVRNRAKLGEKCPHVTYRVQTTVSILNAFHLVDFLKLAFSEGLVSPQHWRANLLQKPSYYCIQVLPEAYKRRLEETYDAFIDGFLIPNLGREVSLPVIHHLKTIISFARLSDESEALTQFWEVTKTMDHLREESFLELFPEYLELAHAEKATPPASP